MMPTQSSATSDPFRSGLLIVGPVPSLSGTPLKD
jgi:hypothetical protein